MDFVKEKGASGEYTIDDGVYYFENPGWSINRENQITRELYTFLTDFCTENNCKEELDNINILF